MERKTVFDQADVEYLASHLNESQSSETELQGSNMAEEIVVYLEDLETYLEPEEYRAFLKARQEVEKYCQRNAEYEKKKADAEKSTEECRKKRSEAKNDIERICWEASAIVSSTEAVLMPAPYYPAYYFVEHDRYINLVRKRKLEQLEEEERRKAEEEAERQQEERAWLAKIEKETQRKQSQIKCKQYTDELKATVTKFKQQLANVKKPKFNYPAWLAGYHPETWCELVLPGKDDVSKWAEPYILEQVPESLRDFVSWELDYEVKMLPRAGYWVVGVLPCLAWRFTVLLLIKVQLRLVEKKFTRIFCGYEHPLKMTPERLGLLCLGPIKWGDDQQGFVIPVGLLSVLAQGKMEAPGIVIHMRSSPFTRFSVEGFDGEVDVHDNFRRFMSKIGSEELLGVALRVQGITDKDTAVLLEDKAKLPLPLPHAVGLQANAAESAIDNSDVKAALNALGYKKVEANEMVEAAELSPDMSTEEKMKAVFKILGA